MSAFERTLKLHLVSYLKSPHVVGVLSHTEPYEKKLITIEYQIVSGSPEERDEWNGSVYFNI